MTTIRDLARRLGVSHTTVSLALRNHASISPATRKRVQAMARKVGYRGNVLVSALLAQVRSGRLRETGEVVPFLTALPASEWTQLPSVVAGLARAKERGGQLGLRVEVFPIGERGELCGQVMRILDSRGMRGLLLPPLPTSLPPLNIDWAKFSTVAIGYSFQQASPHRVANAHFNGIVTCYEKLRAAGCRRIGLALRRDDDDRARHYWLSGFVGASLLQGGARLPPLLMEFSPSRDAFLKWFDRHRPDAIIGMSRTVLLEWLADHGVDVPGDVRYACLDLLNGPWRPLAGIRQSWGDIYATAMEELAGQLSRNEVGMPRTPKVTLIDGQWCDGPTL